MRAHEPHLHSQAIIISLTQHFQTETSRTFSYLSQAKRTIKMSFCGWGGEKYKDHFEDGEL